MQYLHWSHIHQVGAKMQNVRYC